jgi:hypothetical protein
MATKKTSGKKKADPVKYGLNRGSAPVFQIGEQLISPEVAREVARIFGAMGGAATKGKTSLAKKRASRANGKLGGRPRKEKASNT